MPENQFSAAIGEGLQIRVGRVDDGAEFGLERREVAVKIEMLEVGFERGGEIGQHLSRISFLMTGSIRLRQHPTIPTVAGRHADFASGGGKTRINGFTSGVVRAGVDLLQRVYLRGGQARVGVAVGAQQYLGIELAALRILDELAVVSTCFEDGSLHHGNFRNWNSSTWRAQRASIPDEIGGNA